MKKSDKFFERFTHIELFVLVLVIALVTALLFCAAGKLQEIGQRNTCMSNQCQIVQAILIQAQDNGDTLPTADQVWRQMHLEHKVLCCPTKGDGLNDYVYAMRVAGERLSKFPQTSNTIVTADGVYKPSDSTQLANIGYLDSDADKRHNGRAIVGYLDGHAGLTSSVSLNAFDLYDWITGVGVPPLANAAVIASSSANGSSPAKLIDGAASAEPSTSWLSGALNNEWVQIDLGRRQAVSAIRFWNYCQPNNNGCGAKTLHVYVDDIPQPEGSPLFDSHAGGLTLTLPQSSSSCADSGVCKLPTVDGGRFVTIVFLDNYGGSNVGLAEVGIGVDKDTSPQ